MNPVISVFGAAATQPDDPEYLEGMVVGRGLAEAGFVVATGGYGGTMEAVSRGAAEASGRVIGFSAPSVFPGRLSVNEYVTDEIRSDSIAERIGRLVDKASGFITLHGSIGTLAELMVAWNYAYVAPFSDRPPRPIVTVGDQWKRLVDQLTRDLQTAPAYIECVDTGQEAVEAIVRAIPGTGRPLE